MKGINRLVQLSPYQRDIYFDQIRHPQSPCYNVGGYLKLGPVDVARLVRAHSDLVTAHDAFGLRIVCTDDDVAQCVVHERTTVLQQVDLSSETSPSTAAEAWIRQLFATPLAFENTEMFKAALIRLSDSEYWYVGVAHHLAVDGWGFANWGQALARCYNGEEATQVSSCMRVAAEQHAYLGTEKYLSDRDYWAQQCAALPERLLQPFYAGSAGDTPTRSFRVTQQVSSHTFARVEQLASHLSAGPHAVLLAALGACLGLTYRQPDVLISVAVHNRRGAAQKQLIGAFSSVSPLPLSRVAGSRFSDLVRQVASSQKAHFRHQRYPHGDLLRDLGRAGGHALLGDVGFSYLKADSALEIEGRGLELTYVSHESERTPLMVTVWDVRANGGVAVHFDCNEAYFTRDEAGLLARRFAKALEMAAFSPDVVLDSADMLLDGERERILEEFNATAAAYPRDALIHELLEQQAAAQPDAVAVLCGESSLRYGELNARANQLAHALIAQGVRPDDRVAICCERTVDLVIGLLGILKAGGAYVSLDPAYPAERLAFILQDSAPRLLLSTTSLDGHLPAGDVPVLWLDQAPATLASHPVDNPDARRHGLNSRHLAYVIYTSGSTGTPKGVAIEHVNAVNLLAWAQASFTAAELSHTLFATSINFDLSVFELFVPLSSGSTVSLRPDVLSVTAQDTMTLINTVPSGIDALLRSQRVPATVRTINLAGEALKPALVAQLFAGTSVEDVVNLYGPSETTTYSTWVRMGRDHAGRVLIGRPIANTQVYILDAQGEPVPVGVSGELYIGGDGVARGYLNRPALTAERFVRDPFSADPQARMYRTGDLGRWLPDGNIEYLGRNDFQVKIRGFRIELGEIEARLAACAGVREAVALAREDVPGDKRLVAYLTADTGAEISVAELRMHLSSQLPDYMVPNAFVVLDAFPLTPNGKLDRKALPVPDGTSLAQREYEAPQGEIEQALAEIWQSLLNIGQVGRQDHFFELGGHSLLVVTMTARLRAQGLRGEVRDLFASPVLSRYAATLRRGDVEEAGALPPNLLTPDVRLITPELLPLVSLTQPEVDRVVATVPGGVANVQDIYPLLPSQQGILFHHMLDGEGDTYLLRALFAFDGREELDDFLRALDVVVARHDILRTAVVWKGLSTPVQVVHRQACVPVHELALPGEDGALEELSAFTDPRKLRLDLSRAPLSAAYIAEDGAGGWMLSLLLHHLVCDHVTLALALAEIDAIRRGNRKDLVDEVPMRQLVAQALQMPEAGHEAYFRRELSHIDEPTAPFNLLDAHQSGAAYESVELPLSASLGHDIRTEARRRGVSPAVLFHVAWAQVLARCTGRSEVVFGTVLSGRTQAAGDADRAWGMFINTLPIRVMVEGTAAEVIDQTLHRLAELLEHEHAALSLAQRCSSVMPSLPLFTTLLNYRHTGDNSMMPGGMRLLASEESTNYPISIDVDDFGDRFALTAQVVGGLGASRLAGYLAHAMARLTAELRNDGTHSLQALDVMPPCERECLLQGFNATSATYPKDALIHALFEQQAARSPDAVAVVHEGQHLSYGELNAQANQVAHYLRSQGVKPDDRVAICVARGLEMVIGLLGILKSGGAYVPLDPEYPAERLAYMLEDSAPVALLTQAVLDGRLPDHGVPTLRLDTHEAQALLAAQPMHNPELDPQGLNARHLAYVIYTSGSTGTPKGVMVEHVNATNLVLSHSARCELVASDRVLQFASYAFDASVEEIFPALCIGASIVVRPSKLSLDSESFSTYLDHHGVTVAELPTAFWHLWAQTVDQVECRSLRLVVVGGEKAERRALQAWKNAGGMTNRRWLNTYGPTESTVYSVAIVHDEATPFPTSEIPIGRPIANTQVYILDAQGEPVPLGVAGELYIGGDGVARGYLNRPELTAERFVRDPFSADPQARMYRTGDLGRWLPDGNIEYLGRNDFQVKIRGFRIELGEIEARLAACDGVREAVVLAREDVPGDKRLVAYLTANVELSIAEIRTQLSAQLPEYMVPGAFVVLDAFPLTPNGKLDRKVLPAPDGTSLTRREYEAPQGEIEQGLAAIWQSLLKVERIGRHDHFFELGGHSLLVVTMTARLREQGLCGEVRDLFAAPLLSDYAATLSRSDVEEAKAVPPNLLTPDVRSITPELLPLVNLTQFDIDCVVATVPGGVANIQDIYPLLPSQQGILFHYMLDGEGDTYLLRALLAFESRTDLDDFLRALDMVVARHDILRTAVVWEGISTPVQVVHRQARVPVHEIALPDDGDAMEALVGLTDPRRLRLDLTRAPLLAAYVAEDRAGGWMLSLLQHHLACDHVTLDFALAEIDAIRRGNGADLADEVPLRQLVAQALRMPAAKHEAYFRQELGHIDEPTAPFNVFDVRQSGAAFESVALPLDESLGRDICAEARRRGVSPAVLFHVAWAQVLARCTGRNEVVFGTVLSGRMHGAGGADRAWGMFINTLPIRVVVEGRPVDAIDQTRRRLAELLEHEHASLSLAQRCSSVPSSLPLFTALLNYRHSSDVYVIPEGIRLVAAEETTNYPISVSVDDFGERFVLTAQVVCGMDAARLAGYLAHSIASLTAELRSDGMRPLHALDVLPQSERDRVLHDFNATTVAYPHESLIHELFEQQAAASPDAVAVVDAHRVLTYAELNARANRVAHHLIAQGVRPDDRVAVCCERSAELIIGLLGILKAGGAYVPLDAEYPPERLSFMLEDSAPKRLLLQSSLRERLPASEVPQLLLDDSEAELSAYPDHNPDARAHGASSRQLAYVIYTSGSTGLPKGVMVEHRQVLRLVMQDRYVPLAATDGVALCANPAFDAATWEIWATLLHGARLIVITPACLLDVAALGETLQRYEATVLHLTAGLFHQYADALGPVFARLNYLLFGGDRIDADVVRRVLKGARPAHLVHCYGPTETTTFASTHEIRELDAQAISVPIGRPIGNTRIYVLDAQGEPVPVGVTGEIHIGGDGVARGYLNRADLTQERFVRDPFNADPQARMYRTGDVGRWREDGTLEFQGRNDFQVKIRGFRIEPGEIEAKLTGCAGVREAVVLAREDVPGDKRLVAYCVAEDGAQIGAAELRLQLGAQLPEYMLPSAFVMLETFPLTPNGKLDRKALPAPDGASLSVRAYEAPDGEVEEALAEIWRELLQVERIGRHDHFFELGGHSLMVVAMTARLRTQGLRGEVRDLFASPVLNGYAATLSRGEAEEAEDVPPNLLTPDMRSISPELLPLVSLTQAEIDRVVATVPGGVANIQDIYPLLPSQQGILFHHLLDGEGDIYLLRAMLAFDSRDELDDFLCALDVVVGRHDILRTAVVWEGLSTPLQVVHRKARVPVHEVALPGDGDAMHALAGLTDPRRLRLDVTRAPMLAAYVAEDGAGGWMLSLLQHHLVCDHVTLALALAEIAAIRRGSGADLVDEVPLRQLVAQALRVPVAEHEAYFRRELAHIDEPTAPFNLLDAHQSGAAHETVELSLDASLAQDIHTEARRRGVSPAVLFHVAWAQVLARCTGRSEVVFGTVLSGRMHGAGGADRAWGMFINTLPIRVAVEDTATEAVGQTQRRLVELFAHEHAALSLAQRCSGVISSLPLFTTLLNYRHSSEAYVRPEGMRLIASEETTNYPISINVDDFGDHFTLTAQVVGGLDAARLAAYLAQSIASLTAELRCNGAQPLHALDVMPLSERECLLQGFNATAIDYPKDALIHQLFEAQVDAQPDALAVRDAYGALSYAELDAQANRLAHELIARGVGPDARVAICVERSVAMVVGLLGILKAGGAYVPLDPDYPPDRLAFMLHDSAPSLLLTQSSLADLLPSHAVSTLCLDDAAAPWAVRPSHRPDPQALGLGSRHLAYMIYTSGSTGVPKGVMNEHRGVVNRLLWAQREYQLDARNRVLQKTPFGFDVSVWEFFLPLLAGAALVMARPGGHRDPDYLQTLIEAEGITTMHFVPSMLAEFVSQVHDARCRSLRQVLCSGEALPHGVLQRASQVLPQVAWHNLYGPTEAAIDVTAWPCRVGAYGEVVPIGRPIANTQIYILDAHGAPVPMGVPGEIHIGGDGVARGYWNREALTQERFVHDPFHADAQARMYKTGDLGRWLPDGNIEYLGRNDFQVKLRGFRIELGEIEARLSACDGVREAVVLAREDVPGDMRLVAYVVPAAGAEPTAMQLREALQPQLPEYMVPSAFVMLEAFPLTPNGKLDRKALPAPDGTSLTRREYEAPLDGLESTLAGIWQELLELPRIGRNDDFFELGGHSLLAVRLVTRIGAQFGYTVPLHALFAHRTLKAFTGFVQQKQGLDTWREAMTAAPADDELLEQEWMEL